MADNAESKRLTILVDGATGYVGNHLCNQLKKAGHTVRSLVRPKARPADLNFLRSIGCQIFEAELEDAGASSKAFAGADAAVHLIGSIAPKKGENFEQLHAGITELFATRCTEAGVAKVVMLTALGTARDAASQYHRTKWQGEEKLRNSGLACIFFRPSLIIGRTVGERDSKLVKRYTDMIAGKPRIPLIAGGKNKVQPIFVQDLVKAMQIAIESLDAGVGNGAPCFEVAGTETLTMSEFVTQLMKSMNTVKPIVALPIPLAKFAAGFSEALQEVPVLSRDQVKLSMKDNVITKTNHLLTVFNLRPESVQTALESYKRNQSNKPISAGHAP